MTQQDRLGFKQLLKTMVADIKQNRQVFILMVLLWTVLSTLLSAPLLEDLRVMQQAVRADPEVLAAAITRYGPKLFASSIINMMVLMALPTLWSRLLLRGRGGVLGTDLFRCYGLVLFRTLSLIGYQILALISAFILSIMVVAIGGVIGLGQPFLSGFSVILVLMIFVPLYLAFSLSVVGTSIGHHRFGILTALKEMQRFIALWLSMAALIVIVFSIAGTLLVLPFLGENNSPTRISTIISGLANGTMLLLVFTAAIALYRHYLLLRKDVVDA